MKDCKIIIAGAGIGGLTAALGLRRRGFSVSIFEQADELKEIGAGVTISPNASRIFEELGLLDTLLKSAVRPVRHVNRNYATGEIIDQMPARETIRAKFGGEYFQIHRADLHTALAEAVQALDGEPIHLGCRFTELEETPSGIIARFANGREARGDVLIGCDGVKSIVRKQLFKTPDPRFLGYVAWRGTVDTKTLPPNLLAPESTGYLGPDGHVLSYLVRRGELLNYVVFAKRDAWTDEGWSVPADIEDLKREFTGWHPNVLSLFAHTPPDECFKWGLFGRAPLETWVKGRAALLGDAAHPILPFLGQGAGMAIEDGMILARSFEAASDWPEALRRYEAARKPRVDEVVYWAYAEGLKKFEDLDDETRTFLKDRRPSDSYAYNATSVAI